MEYYPIEKGTRITKSPMRRKRLKGKAMTASQLARKDLAELGLITEDGEVIGKEINEAKLNELLQRTRYMNAYVVKGYKFEGVIPEPKDVLYYKGGSW